jgi:RNA polymerase sigma-70 factor (ECF subfamily)
MSPDLGVSSVGLAKWLVDASATPCTAAEKREREARLQEALEQMTPQDREILTLRHFEQLSNADAAEELGISPAASNQRYYRALARLGEIVGPLMGNEQTT